MSDLNKEALDVWGALKPMIDQEISSRTQGMVQRRKAKVTTAPSLATNTIGVTEAFGDEMFLPFVSNMISAKVGDFVWIEWMYGATNAFVSSYAAVDDKNVSVAGVLDVVPRRCYAQLPTTGNGAGWYRVFTLSGDSADRPIGNPSFVIDITIVRQFGISNNELHRVSLLAVYNSIAFANETSKSNDAVVDKIRYTRNGKYGYIDIHYDTSALNVVTVRFDVKADPLTDYQFVATTPTAVASSPSGETVLTEYTFAANTYYHDDNVTSGVRHIVDRRGDIVTVTIESSGNGVNCTAGQYTTVYTLPSDLAPSGSVYTVVDPYGGNNIIGGIIDTSGRIQLYPVLSSTSYYRFTLTYTIQLRR